ncbi:hypothetical protein ABIE78_002977 [Sinorhizobium fredii]
MTDPAHFAGLMENGCKSKNGSYRSRMTEPGGNRKERARL